MRSLGLAVALAVGGGFAALMGDARADQPQPVPADLRPPLAQARRVLPLVYRDGCHVDDLAVNVPRCVYGDPRGTVRVVLFGDSHASQWFPPLNDIAGRRGYRLVSLTHSHCPAPVVRIWGDGGVPCARWRRAALRRISHEHPDLVIVATHRKYVLADQSGVRITSAARTRALWRAGYDTVLRRLHTRAARVALMTDSDMAANVPACLAVHMADARACATRRAVSIDPANASLERALAGDDHVALIRGAQWTCPADPCPPIMGHVLVWRDDNHLTPVIVEAQVHRLARVVRDLLRGPP